MRYRIEQRIETLAHNAVMSGGTMAAKFPLGPVQYSHWVSFLESHPSRISCASPPDQANGQSWSDGFGSSFGRCGPLLAHIASWRWRTSRFASNLPCGRCAGRGVLRQNWVRLARGTSLLV